MLQDVFKCFFFSLETCEIHICDCQFLSIHTRNEGANLKSCLTYFLTFI